VPYAKLDNPQSLNLYSYLSNKPLSGTDLDGHCPQWMQAACETWSNIVNRAQVCAERVANNSNNIKMDLGALNRSARIKVELGFGFQVSAKSKPFEVKAGGNLHDEVTLTPADKQIASPITDKAEASVSGKVGPVEGQVFNGHTEHQDGTAWHGDFERPKGSLGGEGPGEISYSEERIGLGASAYWFIGGGLDFSFDQRAVEQVLIDVFSPPK
jgi:hypothetical protein